MNQVATELVKSFNSRPTPIIQNTCSADKNVALNMEDGVDPMVVYRDIPD